MGERTAGLDTIPTDPNGSGAHAASPRAETRRLESQIEELRDELGGLVAELDRRRHEALDVKLQVRRHAFPTALTGLALIGAAAGFVWLSRWRARRRQSLASRTDRFRQAMTRPERVASEPTVRVKIATAAANAAVATLIKKVLERMVQRAMERRRLTTVDAPRRFEETTTARRGADRSPSQQAA